jgi:hypothetical protein
MIGGGTLKAARAAQSLRLFRLLASDTRLNKSVAGRLNLAGIENGTKTMKNART